MEHRTRSLRRGGKRAILPALVAAAAFALALLVAGCGAPQPGQWDQLTSDPSQPIYAVAQDTSNPNLVYAGGGGAVYRLLATVTQQPVPGTGLSSSTVVLTLAPDPAHEGRVYAGGTGGLYISTHYGDSWQAASNDGFPAGDSIDALTILPGSGTLLAGTTQHGIYSSANEGRSWQVSNNGIPSGANINFFAQDPASHLLYTSVAGVGLFASSDDGTTWKASGTGLPHDVYALVPIISGGATTLFAGTSQGLFASTDGGASWHSHGAIGLPTGKLTALGIDRRAPSMLYAGTGNTVYVSSDAGQAWKLLAPGLDHAVTQIVAVSGQLSQPVVVAAGGAGGLLRYPPPPNKGGGIGSLILNIVIIVALVGTAVFFVVRSRRILADMDRRNRAEARAAAERRDRDALGDYMPPPPSGGGRRPPPPPPPSTQRGQAGPPKLRGYGNTGERPGDDTSGGANGHNGANGRRSGNRKSNR